MHHFQAQEKYYRKYKFLIAFPGVKYCIIASAMLLCYINGKMRNSDYVDLIFMYFTW